MPVSSPRPCSFHACRNLVKDGSGRCGDHPKITWAKKATATKRITGRRLQAMRAKLFSKNPLCAECARNGLVSIATQRDHIIPLEEGGLDDETNEQGLCEACHEKKSKQESQRGRWGRAGQKSRPSHRPR
ncbi:HNH endonuclease [Candidatus Dojkabacteria bacterium]|uniref:HNH endonuclease n=1 Tax=Candidatus Dojkabacteria bacterium TaxID=2099670 RepID=A0A5C7JBQ4_9BACT|nr:MAG: HNH endonuclease [Candidatus Dojkabacteria bacterium]